MDEHPASIIQSTSFLPFGAAHLRTGVAEASEPAPAKPSVKHTIFACTFLLGYMAGYVALGYALILGVERLWTAAFR
jgi:hypothetical protein